MKTLSEQIKEISVPNICAEEGIDARFLQRLLQGNLTRDEEAGSHFCVYFLPHNPQTKKVFMGHHKKSGLWLSPGGHIDKGEGLWEALNREIQEELGVKDFFAEAPSPFLLTITQIERDVRPCKTHFDIWYLAKTNGTNFTVDTTEFYDTKWLTPKEARALVSDKANLYALDALEKMFS